MVENNDIIMTIVLNGAKQEFACKKGDNILEVLRANGVYVPAICNGQGTCGKCKIQILKGEIEPSQEDNGYFSLQEIKDGYRLACKAAITKPCEILICSSSEKDFAVLTEYEAKEYKVNNEYGIHEIKFDDIDNSITKYIDSFIPQRDVPVQVLKKLSGLINQDINGFYEGSAYMLYNETLVLDVFDTGSVPAYGVAIDIGTTTVGFELINLVTGVRAGVYSTINHQREFGADVISRIVCANEGNGARLSGIIKNDIVTGIEKLCDTFEVKRENIYEIVIAGNTTMMHLLLDIPCESLGLFPFYSTITSLAKYNLLEIFDNALGKGFLDYCRVSLLPAVSAYVGGDITSGAIFCGYGDNDKVSLLIDIGTNGEMALFKGKRIVCTSTAAGPAFEGGNISCGTGSIPGAVSKVRYENGKFEVETIGNKAPVGICGSGVMDMVACLVENELIDETGVFEDEEHMADGIAITEKVVFTKRDIRELQLAKSAIRAGLEVLIKRSELDYNAIDNVYLAGGFGFRMNINSAVIIGILPKELQAKVEAVGNSSLGGCVKVLLDKEAKKRVVEYANIADELSLSTDKDFNKLFMDYMYF